MNLREVFTLGGKGGEVARMTNKSTNFDPAKGRPWSVFDALLRCERCGARNRRGERCEKWPIHGNVRCANHGGLNPSIHGFWTFAWRRFQKRRKAELAADWPGASIRVVPAEGFGNRWQPIP